MSTDARRRWFKELIDAGLTEQIFGPPDVIQHATPDVLASCLPPELLARVLSTALSAGAMTAQRVLDVVTPELCAEHLPHEVLWACAVDTAKRSGITECTGGASASDKRRTYLRRVLDTGLAESILSPDDLLRFATPEVLASHLPTELKAKLLSVALQADAMNATLVLNTVGVAGIAANVPMSVIWAALREGGDAASVGDPVDKPSGKGPASKVKPSVAEGLRARHTTGIKPSPAARLPAASKVTRAPTKGGPPAFRSAEWATGDDLEVVEEADLGSALDAVLGAQAALGAEWADEETNVGIDTTSRGK